MTTYQTYLKDCLCGGSGVLIENNLPHCRWCCKPYAEGGLINYPPERFAQEEYAAQSTQEGGTVEGDNFYCLDRLHGGENCITQCELCADGNNNNDKMIEILSKKLSESLLSRHKIKQALLGVLETESPEGGGGCPMCDIGRLRNPNKEHWDDCPYKIARQVLDGKYASQVSATDKNRIIELEKENENLRGCVSQLTYMLKPFGELEKEVEQIKECAASLCVLHSIEQEGLSNVTPVQWIKAVSELSDLLGEDFWNKYHKENNNL